MKLLSPIIFIFIAVSVCDGYRILGAFPFKGKSHFMMFERLMKGLTKKGHQVDVISSFPQKKPYPNYTDLAIIPSSITFINNFTYELMNTLVKESLTHSVATIAGNEVCERLGMPEIQELVRNPPKDPPYDLVIMEIFGAHCFAALGYVLKVPVVGVSSAVLYPWTNDMIANPENIAIVPNNLLSYPQHMNFWQRLWNFVHAMHHKWYFNYLTAAQTEIARKHLGPDIPDIRELENNISMILTNSHISLNGIKPMTPALVEVGGLHVQTDEMQEDAVPLPASLEKWMNESTDGFLYFSFGSMVKIESFPAKHLKIFYNSLGKIAPVRVLMKVAEPSALPPGLPKNIYSLPWIPQVEVLKHPNIKAFITHGGLMGTQESIHYGVPMIGVPLFGDQYVNIDIYAGNNIAVRLDVDTLTEEAMDAAINAILHDPKYRETIQRISKKFRDRPLSPLNTAIYWLEYIIKHGGDSLRSPAMDLTWWQLELLDIYAFLLLATILSVYLLIALPRFLYTLVNSSHAVAPKKKVS